MDPAAFAQETICTLCLERYPPGTIPKDYPFCPECSSEGIDFDVAPFADWMAERSVADFDAMLASWAALADTFLPAYQALKRDRIERLRALKAHPSGDAAS